MRSSSRLLHGAVGLLVGCVGLASAAGRATGQQAQDRVDIAAPAALSGTASARTLPFAPGELLTYTVHTGRFGGSGRAVMWIESPTPVEGREVWPLRFEFSARVGPVKASDKTASWLDVRRFASLRFLKRERHPLSSHDDDVTLDAETGRWSAKDGTSGRSPSDAPLDELSFMYYLRTLALDGDGQWRFERHYVAERNPTLVRVVRREEIGTGAGRFRTVLLEMRVRDPRRYKGDGIIRINLTDDACRIPVRIESRMPVIGAAVMLLESHNLDRCASREVSARAAVR